MDADDIDGDLTDVSALMVTEAPIAKSVPQLVRRIHVRMERSVRTSSAVKASPVSLLGAIQKVFHVFLAL